jgi:hypothetical protein
MTDPDALRAELVAHQRRLAILREQAAIAGRNADPAVLLEIQDITARVDVIERQLAGQPAPQPDAAPADWLRWLPGAAGDVIVANIGPGARQVAVGKDIRQGDAPGPADADDLAARFDQLEAALAALRPQLGPAAEMAAFQLRLLRGELTKDESGTPSATAITAVGGWLLANVPQLAGALAALLAAPAARRALARAGPEAVAWADRTSG